MAKLGPEYRNQSLSWGTMIPDDIFKAVKRYLPQDLIDQYERQPPHA